MAPACSKYGATDFLLGWVRPDFDSESVEYSFLGITPARQAGRQRELSAPACAGICPTDTTLMLTYANAKADYSPATPTSWRQAAYSFRNLLFTAQQRLDTLTLTAEYGEPRFDYRRFRPSAARQPRSDPGSLPAGRVALPARMGADVAA